MSEWDAIMAEAERLERELRRQDVDLNEAEKATTHFVLGGYDEEEMAHYLRTLASSAPARSQQSGAVYRGLLAAWQGWHTELAGQDKARAWGWAVRLARAHEG